MTELIEARLMTDERLAEIESKSDQYQYPDQYIIRELMGHIKAVAKKADYVALNNRQLQIEHDEAAADAAAVRTVLDTFMKTTTPGAKDWLSPKEIIQWIHDDSVKALSDEAGLGKKLRKQFNDIQKIIKEFEDAENEHHYSSGDTLDKRLHGLINHYTMTAAHAVSATKAFRDDMLTWLRAMALVVDMAGNAGTHSEKNARLRGMVELIESAVQKLQNERLEFAYRYWNREDIFKSDYPVRQFVDRIHELERENAELKKGQEADINGT